MVAQCSQRLWVTSPCCYQLWQTSLGTWVPQPREASRRAYSTGAKIVLPRLLHAQTPEQDTHMVQVPGLGAIFGVSIWR